jgi:hypothetical protein
MPQEQEPPRKTFQFKPREFDCVNEPTAPSAPEGKDSKPPAAPASRRDVRDARQLAMLAVRRGERPSTVEERAALKSAGGSTFPEQDPAAEAQAFFSVKVRQPRRRRDYLALLVLGNAIFVPLAIAHRDSGMTYAALLTADAFYFLATTWVMWFVVDKY